jgi:hypothetical protein
LLLIVLPVIVAVPVKIPPPWSPLLMFPVTQLVTVTVPAGHPLLMPSGCR